MMISSSKFLQKIPVFFSFLNINRSREKYCNVRFHQYHAALVATARFIYHIASKTLFRLYLYHPDGTICDMDWFVIKDSSHKIQIMLSKLCFTKKYYDFIYPPVIYFVNTKPLP